MADIDIILATHNNFTMTAWCLKHLYENTGVDFNLIVMDDSADLTEQVVEHYNKEHGNIKFVHTDKPYVHGNAIINEGLEHCTNEFVVYMGNSTIVEPGWIEQGLQFMKQQTDVGLMGFKLLKPSGVIEHAGISFTPGMNYHLNYGVDKPSHWFTCFVNVEMVGFALVLMRKVAVPPNGFDTELYHGFSGFDDLDNCMEVRKNGWQVVFNGYGVAFHYALSTRSKETNAEQKWEDNRQRFIKKWFKNGKT